MSGNIKTWQERTGNHNVRPGSVKHMIAEIAELRAALANSEDNLSQWQAIGENATDDLIRCVTSKIAALAATAPTVAVDAEEYLRNRYGAYRGHHAWRELEEAFNAGRAKLSAGVAIPGEK